MKRYILLVLCELLFLFQNIATSQTKQAIPNSIPFSWNEDSLVSLTNINEYNFPNLNNDSIKLEHPTLGEIIYDVNIDIEDFTKESVGEYDLYRIKINFPSARFFKLFYDYHNSIFSENSRIWRYPLSLSASAEVPFSYRNTGIRIGNDLVIEILNKKEDYIDFSINKVLYGFDERYTKRQDFQKNHE